MGYWLPSGAKTTATCSLVHPENECQRSVNYVWSCIFGNQGIVRKVKHIEELLTALLGKNSIYLMNNMDFKIIDIADCNTCKNKFLAVEYTILIRHYYQSAKPRALSLCR